MEAAWTFKGRIQVMARGWRQAGAEVGQQLAVCHVGLYLPQFAPSGVVLEGTWAQV